MVPKLKMGFLVEGDIDKPVVETLARRLLREGDLQLHEDDVHVHVVRSGGKSTLPWAYSTINFLLQNKKFDHVMVLLDADTRYPPELERQREKVERMFREHGLDDEEVSVCFATPELEAWLLAGQLEKPEETTDAKRDLCRALGITRLTPERAAEQARGLDLKEARRKAPSFEQFAQKIEAVAKRSRATSAAA